MYERFAQAFNKAQSKFSQPVMISYYTTFGDEVYDDDPTLIQSGTSIWVSGTVQHLDTQQGSVDANLVEQGKLINNDIKLFLNGSIGLTGSVYQVRVQLGSPIGEQYTVIPLGGIGNQVNDTIIYKEAYIRRFSQETISGLIINGSGIISYILDGGYA
jgi:hypothetical protein